MIEEYKKRKLEMFRNKFGGNTWLGADRNVVEQYISNLIDEIKSDLLKIADKGELEDLRREVNNYFN